MLFDSSRDKALKVKKEENKFSIFKQNYKATTYDYIFVLVDESIDVYKIEGLRNFPQKCLNIHHLSKHKMLAYAVILYHDNFHIERFPRCMQAFLCFLQRF